MGEAINDVISECERAVLRDEAPESHDTSKFERQCRAWYHALRQDKEWLGDPLEDLEPAHRHNLIAWLRRHAEDIEVYYSFGEIICVPMPTAEVALMDVEQALEDVWEERLRFPEGFLDDTPLMKRLAELEEAWESDGNFAEIPA